MNIIWLIGLISLVSFNIVILVTWVSSVLSGYTYFSAGEPNIFIRNIEWGILFFGIIVGIFMIYKIIKE